MKEIKTWSLAFTYVGCFLGAGFISGQELWQFFGSFGNWGYVGFAAAAVLFTVIGILFVRLTQMTGCADMDRLLVPWDIKWLRGASGAIGAVFLFFVVVSMSAGVGAMLTQLFHVPTWLGSIVFMAAVFLVTLLGVTGMVNAFSALIPVLIAATVASTCAACGVVCGDKSRSTTVRIPSGDVLSRSIDTICTASSVSKSAKISMMRRGARNPASASNFVIA